jgi:hypothetical protein
MRTTLFYKDSGYSVDSITFDLVLDEQHSIESEVTSHPVEDGSQVNDHIHQLPRKGSLTGFVTNHPLKKDFNGGLDANIAQKIASLATQAPFGLESYPRFAQLTGLKAPVTFSDADFTTLQKPTNRALSAWDAFKTLMDAKKVCTIITGVEDYKNVVVTKVSTDRESSTGDALKFKVEFQEVRFVTLQETGLTSATRPDFSTPKGKQATKKRRAGKTGGKKAYDKPVYWNTFGHNTKETVTGSIYTQ